MASTWHPATGAQRDSPPTSPMQPPRSDASPSSSLKSTSPPPSPPSLRLPHTSATTAPKPEDFHLKPCTWDILSTLPSEQRYEVVDGILILQPSMTLGRRIHEKIITHLPSMFTELLKECTVSAGVGMETAVIDTGPSSSRTPPRRRSSRIRNSGRNREADRTEQGQDQDDPVVNVRVPDIMIKPANTDSSSSPSHKSRKHVGLKQGECVIVIEVTSPETRKIDMEVKWQQYFLSGIEIYIIIDVAPLGEQGGVPTVIVGSLMDDRVSIRAPNGYPGVYPRRGQSSRSSYYKREYNGDESIHLHGIPDIGWPFDLITPKLLGDPKAIERRAVKTSRDNDKKHERERQRRFEAEQKNEVLEQKNEVLEENNAVLEENNEELKQSNEELKQSNEELKQKYGDERRQRTALEKKLQQFYQQRGSSSRSGTGPPEQQGRRRPRSPGRRRGRSGSGE